MRWLESVIVPRIDFSEASLEEMVAFMNHHIAAAPGRPNGLHIEVASEKETASVFRRVKSHTPPAPGPPSMDESDGGKITVELSKVPLSELLKYTADVTARLIENQGRVIRLHNVHGTNGTCDPIVTETFRVLAGFERASQATEPDTQTEPETDVLDLSDFITASGVVIYDGDSFQLNTKNRNLTVRSTQENIDLISLIIDSEPTITDRILWWKEYLIPALQSAPPPPPLPNSGLPPPPPNPGIPGL